MVPDQHLTTLICEEKYTLTKLENKVGNIRYHASQLDYGTL